MFEKTLFILMLNMYNKYFKNTFVKTLNRIFSFYTRPAVFNELLNRYTRVSALGLFTFFILGKPAVDVVVGDSLMPESVFFTILFAPIVAFLFILFEPSDYWVRLLSFFYFVLIFLGTCLLFSSLDFEDVGFFVCFDLTFAKLFNWHVQFGLDNFSFLFIILTSFLFCLTFLSCWNNTKSILTFAGLMFIIEFSLFLVFSVLDLFFFFIAYESVIVPVFFIIGIWGGRVQRIYAAYLFFYYTFAGSLSMMFSIIYIYLVVGSTSFFVVSNFEFTILEQIFLFSTFFIAFASKLPLYPLHSWLPEAHVEAPTAGSVLLAGILLKMGGYGIVRWCFILFPDASGFSVDIINTIGSISILYASFSAFQQLDVKRIIAYSSIAHMSFVVMGLFTFTEAGMLGSIFLMLSHGLISSGLFLCIGVLYDRYGTRSILYYGGLGQIMPFYDTVFFILCLSNIAFPGTAGFLGEFLVLYSVYSNSPFLFTILLFGVFMSGVYTIWMYCRIMMGPFDPLNFIHRFSDLTYREYSMFWVILFLVFLFGLFPNLILKSCTAWTSSLLSY